MNAHYLFLFPQQEAAIRQSNRALVLDLGIPRSSKPNKNQQQRQQQAGAKPTGAEEVRPICTIYQSCQVTLLPLCSQGYSTPSQTATTADAPEAARTAKVG